MEYSLKDIIESLDLPLKSEVPLDFDKVAYTVLTESSENFMNGKELAFFIVTNWLDRHCLIDYEEEIVREYVNEWYEDFFC